MAISIADNFSYQGGKPLDARVKFSTVNEMVAVPAANLYDGCFAYVTGTKKYYSYDSTNDTDPTLGKWKEYSSGSGGTSDYDDLTDKPQINSVTLSGNKSLSDLGIAAADDIPGVATTSAPGIVQPDGTSVTINNGVISAVGGGGGSYTAGDGIVIDNNEISTDNMPSTDISDVIYPLPGVMARSIYNNRFNRSDMYDTNEVLIGKWIDGKPLYQKIVSTGGSVPEGATLISRNAMASTGYDAILYTKLSDGTTEVSFDKDYSTDETIVGKWIDGKPIYQKVMTGLSISLTWDGAYNTKGTAQLPVASADLDTVIQVFGMLQNKAILTFGYIPADNKIVGSFGGSPVNILVWQYTKTTD